MFEAESNPEQDGNENNKPAKLQIHEIGKPKSVPLFRCSAANAMM